MISFEQNIFPTIVEHFLKYVAKSQAMQLNPWSGIIIGKRMLHTCAALVPYRCSIDAITLQHWCHTSTALVPYLHSISAIPPPTALMTYLCSQSSKKSGSWDLGSRTFFWRNPDIFGWDQKSDPFIDIWLIFLLKMKHNLMTIGHKRMVKSFKTIYIKNIILICELFTKIWKLDIFIP